MAYADARTTNRKLGAGAAVLALEAGLAWAIIAGLAYTVTRTPPPHISTFSVTQAPDPKPIPTPQVQPKDPVEQAPQHKIERSFDFGPAPMPTFVAEGVGEDDGIGEVEFPKPVPLPNPKPSFQPKSAKPKGNTGQWVTTNDYPTSDLRIGHEGTVRYRVSVDADGKVTDCSVVKSSGWPGLDSTTCSTLSRRAHFEPAMDENGARTSGSFSGIVTWRIPEE